MATLRYSVPSQRCPPDRKDEVVGSGVLPLKYVLVMLCTIGSHVDMKSTGLTIGAVSDRFGLAPHVLRHWEAEGLLCPARTANGHRHYSRADLFRVAAIVNAKRVAVSLDDIRALLNGGAERRQARLRRHRDALAEKIAEQQATLALLDQVLACRHDDPADCPRFRDLLAEQIGDRAPSAPTAEP